MVKKGVIGMEGKGNKQGGKELWKKEGKKEM